LANGTDGPAIEPVLQVMGVIRLRVKRPEEVAPRIDAALTMAFQSGNAVAMLPTQKLPASSSVDEVIGARCRRASVGSCLR
jgi:sulfopyruvate decarboxylase TPP-binding subunit